MLLQFEFALAAFEMHRVSAQVGDVVFVSLEACDVQRKATVAKDSTAIVLRADEEQPVIACP